MKAGFSSSAALRPPWCILAGASGMHSVCVCQYHQNAKLMIHAAGLKDDCESLISLLVCDVHKEECMIGNCGNCPGSAALKSLLDGTSALNQTSAEFISFQQWVSGRCCRLETLSLPTGDFKERLVEVISELAAHHFVSKSHARYLRGLRSHLPETALIVVMDFVENYSFIVQDAPQSYH